MAFRHVFMAAMTTAILLAQILTPITSLAQQVTNEIELRRLAGHLQSELERHRTPLYYRLLSGTDPAAQALRANPDIQLMYFDDTGMPVYYTIHNLNAAKTISTYNAWPGGGSGLDLTGAGTQPYQFAIWDRGGVLVTHREFQGRVIQMDSPDSTHQHSTHVAGTMAAAGISPDAKGMSFEAGMNAYDFQGDLPEMADAAVAGLQVSNHSYGPVGGWEFNSVDSHWYWHGDITVSTVEDYKFGFYTSAAAIWDAIAYYAPYYLICQSAGNDRDDDGPTPGGIHYVYSGGQWVLSTDVRDPDGGTDGYDCIVGRQGAKNILVVGAVEDIPGGYTQPGDVVQTAFSSWGPTDDGRIKPDIVANGSSLYSCSDADTNAYVTLSGTSMSAPNASGSINLLVRHFENIRGTSPRAATMKAIVIHSADEAGASDGPDYQNGWGLMNTVKAANLIGDGGIIEATLADGLTHEYDFSLDTAENVRVTISWVDLPGASLPPSLNPRSPQLVNDLDLRVELVDSAIVYEPWVLDVENPADPAATGDNIVDNVEQVYIADAYPGTYRVTVNHKGSLVHGAPWNTDEQPYSIVSSESLLYEPSPHHYVSTNGSNTDPFDTPAKAAHTLEAAIGAADNGDSVHVATDTFSDVTLDISRGIVLDGAWDSGFSTRDIDNGKTVLLLAGNITVASDQPVVIDGFEIRNGTAANGGAIEILGTETTVQNCDIRQNEVSNGSSGYGGGLYAYQSTIHVTGCEISSNTAVQGGGVYLDDCTGTISNTVVSSNELIYGVETPSGGGICIVNSTGVAMSGNTIAQNSADPSGSQAKGGGLCLLASTDITLDGDVITYNQAGLSGLAGSGGGIYLEASEITMTGVTISRCQAKTFGGGIHADPASTVAVTESNLMWNSAVIGGGAYLGGPSTTINHNLVVGNTGIGCYVVGPSDGSIIGNTMDRNTGATGGALYIASTSIPLFDNIIVNSTGDGIRCAGTPTPAPEYNDVWNNSGSDYTGCTPGPGSISADPIFVDTSAVDYHLGLHSPAIDTGNPGPTYADPDGSRGDMGRYGSHVFVMDQPAYPKNVVVALDSIDAILSWASSTETDIASYGVYKDTTAAFAPSADNFVQLVAAPDTTFNTGPPDADAYYKVCVLDSSDYSSGFSGAAAIDPTGVEPEPLKYTLALDQNVPNPFNPVTRIGYELDRRVGVTLAVYDVAGRCVKRLVAGEQGPGRFAVEWDGTTQTGGPAATGVYFYRLQAGERTMTRKMLLLK